MLGEYYVWKQPKSDQSLWSVKVMNHLGGKGVVVGDTTIVRITRIVFIILGISLVLKFVRASKLRWEQSSNCCFSTFKFSSLLEFLIYRWFYHYFWKRNCLVVSFAPCLFSSLCLWILNITKVLSACLNSGGSRSPSQFFIYCFFMCFMNYRPIVKAIKKASSQTTS